MRCHFSTPCKCRDVTSPWNAATIDTHPRTPTTTQLQAVVKQLVQSANTTSTNRQYHHKWVTFVDFHEHVMQVPMRIPAQQVSVAMFAAHLKQKGLRSSTIKTYMTSISNVHKLLGHADPTDYYLVKKTQQGISNTEPKNTLQRLPIMNTELKLITQAIPYATSCIYTQIMLKALFHIAYHACLRVGEAVYSNQQPHTLTMDHITISDGNSYTITFSSYKHSKSATPTLVMHKQHDAHHCPVTALRNYLLLRGGAPGPIFIDKAGEPVARDGFAQHLKTCLQLAGLPAHKYNTHSLRIGRITQLALDRTTQTNIKIVGRWKSDAYLRYIKPTRFELPH